MNELQIFSNPDFGEIRTIEQNGEPWFVAADVCRALEIANSRDALTRIDEDEKGVVLTDTLGGAQTVATVNEPGLYSLVLGSRKPEAKAFKRWITHEVIPSIRKTGGYHPRKDGIVWHTCSWYNGTVERYGMTRPYFDLLLCCKRTPVNGTLRASGPSQGRYRLIWYPCKKRPREMGR